MVLQGHMTYKNHDISTTRAPMTTELGRMATYQDAGSHNLLITELCKIGYSLTRGGSARKSLSRHRLLVVSHQEIDPNYFEHSPL